MLCLGRSRELDADGIKEELVKRLVEFGAWDPVETRPRLLHLSGTRFAEPLRLSRAYLGRLGRTTVQYLATVNTLAWH